jgi:hypothetical protein
MDHIKFMCFHLCSWNCLGNCPYLNLTTKLTGVGKRLYIPNYIASLSIKSYQVLTRTAPAHSIQHSEKLSTPGSELMFVKQKMRLAVAVAHIAGLVEYQNEERLVQLRSSCMKLCSLPVSLCQEKWVGL